MIRGIIYERIEITKRTKTKEKTNDVRKIPLKQVTVEIKF